MFILWLRRPSETTLTGWKINIKVRTWYWARGACQLISCTRWISKVYLKLLLDTHVHLWNVLLLFTEGINYWSLRYFLINLQKSKLIQTSLRSWPDSQQPSSSSFLSTLLIVFLYVYCSCLGWVQTIKQLQLDCWFTVFGSWYSLCSWQNSARSLVPTCCVYTLAHPICNVFLMGHYVCSRIHYGYIIWSLRHRVSWDHLT